eukprot:TRINITY_DN40917_c0_g1_i1.p1 TRINITY_DN40917_c0_g1~~TRINITY_DN40917_c0_g1_i1.p1  ORF type:complete len:617 (-),score=75.96 TRINITY_DN40917_c0_g1_i1:133-1914(-)
MVASVAAAAASAIAAASAARPAAEPPPLSLNPRGMPSYEEIIADHVYPATPRQHLRSMIGGSDLGSYSESFHRFVRTSQFLTPRSCFNSTARWFQCCVVGIRGGAASLPHGCFSIYDVPHLCCEKSKSWEIIFEQRAQKHNSTTTKSQTRRLTTSTHGCEPLRSLEGSNLLSWVRGLVGLPMPHQAPCIAGKMAGKFNRADFAEAREGLLVFLKAVLRQCFGRRMLTALRRNLMLWHMLSSRGQSWPLLLMSTFRQLLSSVERCRRALPRAPTVHLHIPKTAGSSLCSWANDTGLGARRLPGSRCQLWGDGAFWLGERAVPASCAHRLREARRYNLSWMTVERWIDLPLCEELQYIVALRAPVSRTTHHFQHLFGYYEMDHNGRLLVDKQFKNDFYGKLWRSDQLDMPPPLKVESKRTGPTDVAIGSVSGLADWLALFRGYASNYQVRALAPAGRGLAFLEDSRSAERRLQAAMVVLEQFEAVIVVGDGFLRSWHGTLLSFFLKTRSFPGGMQPFPLFSHVVGRKPLFRPFSDNMYTWSPGELDELRNRNAADMALLEHAEWLQQLDLEYLSIVGDRMPLHLRNAEELAKNRV